MTEAITIRSMPTISVRQPWAWLIVNGYKPFENRTWNTNYRGPMLIHAAKKSTHKDYVPAKNICYELGLRLPDQYSIELKRGGIVGAAFLDDVVTQSDDPFFFGPYGFALNDAFSTEFFERPGQLSIFQCHLNACCGNKGVSQVGRFCVCDECGLPVMTESACKYEVRWIENGNFMREEFVDGRAAVMRRDQLKATNASACVVNVGVSTDCTD